MQDERTEDHTANGSIVGCLIPAYWILVGNGILALCAVAIVGKGTALFSIADVFYWLAVGSLLAARYADIRYLTGHTAEGALATMAHWRRYAVILVAVSTVLWIVVHLIPDLGL